MKTWVIGTAWWLFFTLSVATVATAQSIRGYTPLGVSPAFSPPSVPFSPDLRDIPKLAPECQNIPSVAEIQRGFRLNEMLLTSSVALKLDIAFVSLGTTQNQLVFVQDFSRTKECLATDGNTVLLYGQTIRTVITLSDWSRKGGLSLPFIAADAELNNKRHLINIDVRGFTNPEMVRAANELSGKVMNVENYAKFSSIQKRLTDLAADQNTVHHVERLGVIANIDEGSTKQALAISFAVKQIERGRSCFEAIDRFRDRNAITEIAIRDAYTTLVGACDASSPDTVAKAKAKQYLLGLKVNY